MRRPMRAILLATLVLAGAAAARAADFPNPLPVEPTAGVKALPAPLPDSFVFLDYLSDQKVELLDTAARPPVNVRGNLGANGLAVFLQATGRPELYVAETFMSRGVRGQRTDVVTIYDARTLAPTGEVVLPGAKRGLFVIQPNAFQFADHEKLALVFNFTPGSSVTVVDLPGRKVLGEAPIPGCALIYPTGPRGFSTLCANGTLLSVQLDAAGKVAAQSETAPFNDIDNDAMFSAPAVQGMMNWFVTFKGHVKPIDLSEARPKLLEPWSLVTAEEARADWRPSGWQLAAAGQGGSRLYVIMQPGGHEGSHKEGGQEVWVFDTASHAKVATIKLKSPCQSIAVTGGARPLLLATCIASTLDAFDAVTGEAVSSVPVLSQGATTLIYPVRH